MIRTAARSTLLKRSIATQAAPKAQITELSNGIVVASEPNSNAATASIGVVFGSGSSAENPYSNGVSSLLSRAFSSSFASEAAKSGLSLSSTVGREFQSYIVNHKVGSSANALEFLQSKLNTPVQDSVFESIKASTLRDVEASF